MASRLRLVCPSLIAAWVIACAGTLSISQVLQQGAYADGHRVVLTGDVVGPPEEVEAGSYSYEIEDGTGRILIQTRKAPPLPCHRVRVQGKVGSVFAEETNNARPGVVYGRWWVGLAITEDRRQDLGLSMEAQFLGCSAGAPASASSPLPECSPRAGGGSSRDSFAGS
jgi:hypothetical protein